jgi:hypothetical protein
MSKTEEINTSVRTAMYGTRSAGSVSVVEGVLARVVVGEINSALPIYERLSAGSPLRRFNFREVELA